MQRQVNLKNKKKPLYIPYPVDYSGQKSGDPDDESFFLSGTPRMLTEGEVFLAREVVAKLPYDQEVVFSGCALVANFDLPNNSAELDLLEVREGLSSTAKSAMGGRNTVRQRQIIISERLQTRAFPSEGNSHGVARLSQN